MKLLNPRPFRDWYDYLHDPTDHSCTWDRKPVKWVPDNFWGSIPNSSTHWVTSSVNHKPVRGFQMPYALPKFPSKGGWSLGCVVIGNHLQYRYIVVDRIPADPENPWLNFKPVRVWNQNDLEDWMNANNRDYAGRTATIHSPTVGNVKLFFENDFKVGEILETCEAPLLHFTFGYRFHRISSNPNLSELGLTFINPNKVVQEVDMWLANRDYVDPLHNPLLSDRIKAVKAGHGDKYSFRRKGE